MTTALLCIATAGCLAGAAYCFRRAFREIREPVVTGWVHITPVVEDIQEAVR